MKTLILVFVVMSLLVLSPISYSLDKSLVLYLPFDEGSGDTVKDSTQYGNDGVIVPNGDWVNGKYGKAIQITAGKGHVDIQPSDSLTGDVFVESFTLSGWIKPALTGDAFQHIWRSRPVESGHNTLFVNTGGFLSWRGMAPAWTTLCEGTAGDIAKDEWSFFTIVSDGKNFRMYVNDKLVKESAFMKTNGTIMTYHVGGDGLSENYTGAIDEICVWNRTLSENEIINLYTKGMKAFMAVDSVDKLITMWSEIKAR
jgi:hypothetical protein